LVTVLLALNTTGSLGAEDKQMTTISELATKAEEALKRLGKERDILRDLILEVDSYLDDAEAAYDEIYDAKLSLESAADTLSQKV